MLKKVHILRNLLKNNYFHFNHKKPSQFGMAFYDFITNTFMYFCSEIYSNEKFNCINTYIVIFDW